MRYTFLLPIHHFITNEKKIRIHVLIKILFIIFTPYETRLITGYEIITFKNVETKFVLYTRKL